MKHPGNRTILLFAGLLSILSVVFFSRRESVFSESRKTPVQASADVPKKTYNIFPTEIPEELDFAEEPVPVNLIDIRESLDREILVNTYWQSQTLLFLKRSHRYFPIIESVLKKHKVPSDFKYLAVAESGLMNAVSPANAVGFWQFLEGTAKDYGLEVNSEVDERYHLEKSTEAACKYLLESYMKYGSWTMAAASYNAGRKNLSLQIDRQKENNYYDLLLGEETSRYIFRILSYKLLISNPSAYGFYFAESDLYPEIPVFEVSIENEIKDFAEFAKRYGISYKVLKILNPWLRQPYLTNTQRKTYYLKIPREGYFKSSLMNKVENEQSIKEAI